MSRQNLNPSAKPRVSVIIPTYNGARTLGRAISSVLNQTYGDFELIIVDDGSTDGTSAVVNAIHGDRVKYIRHRVNKGVSAARNTGINEAKGELIGFLDSDDEWLPNKLQKQVDKFDSASARVGLVYGSFLIVDDKTKAVILHEKATKTGYVYLDQLKANVVGSATPVVRKECFHKVGLFDEDLRVGEDWDMWLRVAEQYEFDCVPDVIAKYYRSPYQVTGNLTRETDELSKFTEKNRRRLSEHPQILAFHLKWLGQKHMIQGKYTEAREYFLRAARTKPLDVRLYLHLFAAYAMPHIYRALWKTGFMVKIRGTVQWLDIRHRSGDSNK